MRIGEKSPLNQFGQGESRNWLAELVPLSVTTVVFFALFFFFGCFEVLRWRLGLAFLSFSSGATASLIEELAVRIFFPGEHIGLYFVAVYIVGIFDE